MTSQGRIRTACEPRISCIWAKFRLFAWDWLAFAQLQRSQGLLLQCVLPWHCLQGSGDLRHAPGPAYRAAGPSCTLCASVTLIGSELSHAVSFANFLTPHAPPWPVFHDMGYTSGQSACAESLQPLFLHCEKSGCMRRHRATMAACWADICSSAGGSLAGGKSGGKPVGLHGPHGEVAKT
jgi:hypothetical protein